MTMLGWNLALALGWCALAGRLSLGELALGFAVSLAVLAWLDVDGRGRRHAARVPIVLAFAAVYAAAVARSAIRLAWDVITPRARRRPAIVVVPLEVETAAELTVLANLVTFAPGTLALEISEDGRAMTIHAMFAGDPEAPRREVRRLERWVRRILR